MTIDDIQKDLTSRILKYPSLREGGVFLYGSSIKHSHFHDVDIGVLNVNENDLALLADELEESAIPYKVDIVNFSHVSDTFKEKVFHDGVVWLTRKKK